jgi:hypothetical protein
VNKGRVDELRMTNAFYLIFVIPVTTVVNWSYRINQAFGSSSHAGNNQVAGSWGNQIID